MTLNELESFLMFLLRLGLKCAANDITMPDYADLDTYLEKHTPTYESS